jgi:hypothetical protein
MVSPELAFSQFQQEENILANAISNSPTLAVLVRLSEVLGIKAW